MTTNDVLHAITDYAGLAAFVAVHPGESPDLEYKPLFNVSTCNKADCKYCSIPKKKDGQTIGFPLPIAAVAFANKEGGWIIIGAERYDAGKGLHRLETSRCENHPYTPEEVQERIDRYTTPAVRHSVAALTSPDGVPAFLVRVDAGTRLYGFRGPNGDEIRVRRGLENATGRVEEIELQVLVKEQVESNREFREQLRHDCMELLNGVLGTFGPDHETPKQLVEGGRFDFTLGPGSGELMIQHIYRLDSMDVVHRLPRDVWYFLRDAATLDSAFHGRLNVPEAKLISRAKSRIDGGESFESLSVMREISDRAEDRNEERLSRQLVKEGLGFSDAFDAFVAATGDKLLGTHEKRASIFHLADTLVEFVPIAVEVLAFYERVKSEYGTYALAVHGIEY